MRNIYGLYKRIRNASWQALIDNNVNELPVDIVKVVNDNGIILLKNSSAKMLGRGETGLSVCDDNQWFIIYDDTVEDIGRRRFTLAHELGHIFLGHPLIAGFHERAGDVKLPKTEVEANSFAVRFLVPSCVLWGLDIRSAADIARICGVSYDEAEKRAKRMSVLRKRGKFLTSPVERRLFEQFKPFIESRREGFSTLHEN